MFTGIIEGRGQLLEKKSSRGGLMLRVEAEFELVDPVEGESIAVNGICLTAYDMEKYRFSVDVSPESVSRTTLGGLNVGAMVNMERALRLSDRLGGHIVSGHVDCIARLEEVKNVGDFTLLTFMLAKNLERYLIEKGSVAIDGVSLTVNWCQGKVFQVSIIPHTLRMTTLEHLKKGSSVNIEVDVVGKYVEKLLRTDSQGKETRDGGIKAGFLAEHGFL